MYRKYENDDEKVICHFCNNIISIETGQRYTNYKLVQLKFGEPYHTKCNDCVLHFPRSIKDILDMELRGKIKVYIRDPVNTINIRYAKREDYS